MPVIIDFLNDQSSVCRRLAAAIVLGEFVQGSAYVIDPYFDYPHLLDCITGVCAFVLMNCSVFRPLFQCLTVEEVPAIRRAVIRALGVLGAPSSIFLKSRDASISQSSASVVDGKKKFLDAFELHRRKDAKDDYFVLATVNALLRVASDSSQSSFHGTVVDILTEIVSQYQRQCTDMLVYIIPAYLTIIQGAQKDTVASAENKFDIFTNKLGECIRSLEVSQLQPFVPTLLNFADESFRVSNIAPPSVSRLMDHIAFVLCDELKPYLPRIFPNIQRTLLAEVPSLAVFTPVLALVETIAVYCDGWQHALIPALSTLFSLPASVSSRIQIGMSALKAATKLATHIDIQEELCLLVQAIVESIDNVAELRPACMDLLVSIIGKSGSQYVSSGLHAVVHDVVVKHRVTHAGYENLLRLILSGEGIPEQALNFRPTAGTSLSSPTPGSRQSTSLANSRMINVPMLLNVNSHAVRQAVEAPFAVSSNEAWADWLRNFTNTLLRCSPFPCLYACTRLAETNSAFRRELFNAAFTACWEDLFEEDQERVLANFEAVLNSESYDTSEIAQVILELAEFMESMHKGKLPMDEKLLASAAFKTKAYAKALRFETTRAYELLTLTGEFGEGVLPGMRKAPGLSPDAAARVRRESGLLGFVIPKAPAALSGAGTDSPQKHKTELFVNNENHHTELLKTMESLIGINQLLHMPFAAEGLFELSRCSMQGIEDNLPAWYKRLNRWDQVLKLYRSDEKSGADQPFSIVFDKFRCMNELGMWSELHEQIHVKWPLIDDSQKRELASIACSAALGAQHVEQLPLFLSYLPAKEPNLYFYKAVVSFVEGRQSGDFKEAYANLALARDLIDVSMTSLLRESYARAFNQVVQVQLFAEMEEVIEYHLSRDFPEKQNAIRDTWRSRIYGGAHSVEVWQKIMTVRALVLRPSSDVDVWLNFSNICLENNRPSLSLKILFTLFEDLGVQIISKDRKTKIPMSKLMQVPLVSYSYVKHLWKDNHWSEAREILRHLIDHLSQNPYDDSQSRDMMSYSSLKSQTFDPRASTSSSLLARCHHRMGDILAQSETDEINEAVLSHFAQAVRLDENWYRAWHDWSLANYQAAAYYEEEGHSEFKLIKAVCNSVNGFYRAIALRPKNCLQDILRLLSLWFNFGHHSPVIKTINNGRAAVNADTWLPVVSQFTARLDTASLEQSVRDSIMQTLLDIAKSHPQAIILPLSVAARGSNLIKLANICYHANSATRCLEQLRENHPLLVEQANLVGEELRRSALLWVELWQAALQEAARSFYELVNPNAMMDILKPLHNLLSSPETPSEAAFFRVFKNDLDQGLAWCERFQQTNSILDINTAWRFYNLVLQKVNSTISRMSLLDLRYISPKLYEAKNLAMVIPGTYSVSSASNMVTIAGFDTKLTVLSSKQRPRRMSMRGSDGNVYEFLLKGHEV